MRKRIIVIIAVALLLGSMFVFVRSRYIPVSISDTILSETVSPDGKNVATVFERDCGATTDFSRILVLRKSGTRFNPDRSRVFVVAGRPRVEANWSETSKLTVRCKTNKIFKSDEKWQNVRIEYLTSP